MSAGSSDSVKPSDHRDMLGRRVREVWVAWAQRQPNPKPSWLAPYDELSEEDKEADRCIGSALWGDGFADGLKAAAAIRAVVTARNQPSVEQDDARP